ncbi:hypothetical protein GWI33_019486 [Rhynchophorus ferrugineus]|uniref:Uncharacterized protein n=1 Tax=Rhynchophorus ferrugineus TaxID=354439 RepID=A0A834I5B2_RHYFE|nr:hypothetical protein GWI33_019486 [Rhynchophorus ferrugineus]
MTSGLIRRYSVRGFVNCPPLDYGRTLEIVGRVALRAALSPELLHARPVTDSWPATHEDDRSRRTTRERRHRWAALGDRSFTGSPSRSIS